MTTNRLANETSPYLLQHAHNPVDWYPWGGEAFDRAKAENKPILLSVGYSACHWCHVMERESFENHAIASLMNESFVCVKVDREERPDVDSIYMGAVQAMTGQGGWPMTVFLTPDGKPFYGGTYFPPEDRGGLPSFPRVLQAIASAYRQKRSEIILTTDKLLAQLRHAATSARGFEPLTTDVLNRAFSRLAGQFDGERGGFGIQPKFPQPMTYELLLRQHLRTGDPEALEMVTTTLDRMAMGGIYDQLRGGFHRYSTDAFWLVPHFEKMLYDNALLARLYLHAHQVTDNPLYRRVVEETLDYALAEMTDPAGGFYSAQDADSEGVEGKFFVWRPEAVIEALGKDDAEIVNRYYGVTIDGNFEGMSILNVKTPPAEFAAAEGISQDQLDSLLRRARARLLEARSRRVRPGLDDKVLTSWNALMIAAFAEAGAVLDRPQYTDAAAKAAAFILDALRPNGRLLRTYRNGQAKLNGYLEDYAFLAHALLALHEATFEARWLREAIALGNQMVELFWDDTSGQFYDTGADHEDLIIRPRDTQDNATPSGSAMAADLLLRLAVVTGDGDLERRAVTSIRSSMTLMSQYPMGAGHWLCALDFYLAPVKEIAIIGNPNSPDIQALAGQVFSRFLPNRVLLSASPAHADPALDTLPLLQDRPQIHDRPTAYVCRNYVCNLPVTDPQALASQLAD